MGILTCWFTGVLIGWFASVLSPTADGGVFLDLCVGGGVALLAAAIFYRLAHLSIVAMSPYAVLLAVASSIVVMLAYKLISRWAMAKAFNH